jgi:hypothetical protein
MRGAVPLLLIVDPKVTVGDLLTAGTVVIAAITLFLSWRGERKARDRERANAVRTAASETLAKLERWQELAMFFYQEIQPLFIDVSDMLSPKSFDLANARDALWKGLTNCRAGTQQRILTENIELAYVGLQVYDSRVYAAIGRLMECLRGIDNEVYGSFIEYGAQDAVQNLIDQAERYEPAMLGNALRETAEEHAHALRDRSSSEIAPMRAFLLECIARDDQDLLRRRGPHELPSPGPMMQPSHTGGAPGGIAAASHTRGE